jgi:hypothetical protein
VLTPPATSSSGGIGADGRRERAAAEGVGRTGAARPAPRRPRLPTHLPKEEAAVRYVNLLRMTVDDTAQALALPLGTVSTLPTALAKLEELARESKRTVDLGVRLPGKRRRKKK